MNANPTTFAEIPTGTYFLYDGEIFQKSDTGDRFDPPKPSGGLAWSFYCWKPYKEWAFDGDEMVYVVQVVRIEH